MTTSEQGPVCSELSPDGVSAIEWEEFDGSPTIASTSPPRTFAGETLTLRMAFGHTQVRHEEIPRLRSGSVVPLDGSAREPVAIHADGQLIGWGEVLAVEGKLAVRVVELASAAGKN
jgi:flagellar motor switch protein FliN/FliY